MYFLDDCDLDSTVEFAELVDAQWLILFNPNPKSLRNTLLYNTETMLTAKIKQQATKI